MESFDRHGSTRPKFWSVFLLEVVHKWQGMIWSTPRKYLRSYSCRQPRMDLLLKMLREFHMRRTLDRFCLAIFLCPYRKIYDSHKQLILETDWMRWRKDVDCSERAIVNLWGTGHHLCHIYQSNTYKWNDCPKWRNHYPPVLEQCAPGWANKENIQTLKQLKFNTMRVFLPLWRIRPNVHVAANRCHCKVDGKIIKKITRKTLLPFFLPQLKL